jgi:hypothetical protein
LQLCASFAPLQTAIVRHGLRLSDAAWNARFPSPPATASVAGVASSTNPSPRPAAGAPNFVLVSTDADAAPAREQSTSTAKGASTHALTVAPEKSTVCLPFPFPPPCLFIGLFSCHMVIFVLIEEKHIFL